MIEHKIEFEKLKDPEDQLAMESVRFNFQDEIYLVFFMYFYLFLFGEHPVELEKSGIRPDGDGDSEKTLEDDQSPPSGSPWY